MTESTPNQPAQSLSAPSNPARAKRTPLGESRSSRSYTLFALLCCCGLLAAGLAVFGEQFRLRAQIQQLREDNWKLSSQNDLLYETLYARVGAMNALRRELAPHGLELFFRDKKPAVRPAAPLAKPLPGCGPE